MTDPFRRDRPNPTSADGRPMNGVVRASFEAHCAGCETAYTGLGHTASGAAVRLRRDGWTRRGGLWRCAACSEGAR